MDLGPFENSSIIEIYFTIFTINQQIYYSYFEARVNKILLHSFHPIVITAYLFPGKKDWHSACKELFSIRHSGRCTNLDD